MLETRFYWKLFAGYVLLILVASMVVAITASVVLERAIRTQIEQRLSSTARLVEAFVVTDSGLLPAAGIQSAVQRLTSANTARVTVISNDGIVLADNWESPKEMDNHAQRPEVLQAAKAGTGASRRFSSTIYDDLQYYALRLDVRGQPVGYVRTALRLDTITGYVQHLRYAVAGATLLAVLFALALGLLVSRQVTAPLTQIAKEIEALAHGQVTHAVHTTSHDEIGALARSYNRMSATIQNQLSELDQDRTQLQGILSSMVEGVLAVDTEERILHVNRAAGRMFGINPNSCLSKRTWEAVRVPQFIEAIKGALESGEDSATELTLSQGDTQRQVSLAISALRDSDGEMTGVVAVVHDLTKLRQLEQVRQDFVANVSHELKTPLTAIRGMTETMLEDAAMDPGTRSHFLERVRLQTDRLSKLVSDLLSLSRIESTGGELERRLIDVRAPVREVVKRMQPQADAQQVRLSCDVPEVPVQIWADHESIVEAVSNLLDNAIKYTPAEGQVHVTLESDEQNILLSVKDTGIGINPEHHNRIFERFYRVDKARSRELGGTGLGLAIVKHITLAHGGRVSVESAQSQGSTFRIYLPVNLNA